MTQRTAAPATRIMPMSAPNDLTADDVAEFINWPDGTMTVVARDGSEHLLSGDERLAMALHAESAAAHAEFCDY